MKNHHRPIKAGITKNTHRPSQSLEVALNLAFIDGKITTDSTNLDKAKEIFKSFIDSNSVSMSWVYLKYADLISDEAEKIKLYITAYEKEVNIYSCIHLINIYLNNSNLLYAVDWLLKLAEIDFDNWYIEHYLTLMTPADFYDANKSLEKSEFKTLSILHVCILVGNLAKSQEWLERLRILNKNNTYLQKYAFLKNVELLDGIYKSKLLPRDFDAAFYFKTHNDLSLKSELHSILHYLEYGTKELRDYKETIPIPFKERELQEIVLFSQYYNGDNKTKKEILECLEKNLCNILIDKVVIFCEKGCSDDLVRYQERYLQKLLVLETSDRLSFKYWFEYALDKYPQSIKVLSNSDIYFDETIDVLRQIEYKQDILYTCSRMDLDEEGNLVKSKVDRSPDSALINNTRSQDCWIFKNKLIDFETNFILGYENCDILLKYRCISSGCNFLNLYDHMRCIHVDSRINKVRRKYSLITGNLDTYHDTKINRTITKNIRPILHIFPFESTNIKDVNYRQNFAIKSYIDNKTVNTKLLCFGDKNLNMRDINFAEIQSSVKSDSREYFLLNELIDFVLKETTEDQYIVYTNSDCYIDERFYQFIADSNYDYIEYFRQDVENNEIVGSNKDGIDGFACSISAMKQIQDKLQGNRLVIGSPYWDAVVSNIAREHIGNSYQDQHLLFHKKHKPRWSLNSLDIGGQINLETLNNLYQNEIIHCRKAEIKSDNLVIRIIDTNTDLDKVKTNVVKERFSKDKITEFDYNYLFIEKKSDDFSKPLLNDESIGTTSGTRYFVPSSKIPQLIEDQNKLYLRHVILDDTQDLNLSTKFTSNYRKPRLGIVFAAFNLDSLRVKAIKKAINQLQKQSIWNDCDVAFIELLQNNQARNFSFSKNHNINHLKIYANELNRNLFQKECLWNIGGKKLVEQGVDNIIFIDADTYSQDTSLFARVNKLLYTNPKIVYQLGDCIVTIKNDDTITRVQWLWSDFSKLQAKNSYCFGPCGGFAISKTIFERMGGFNPYGFLYGGDILFLYELDKRTHSIWNWAMNNMKIFHNITRKIKNDDIIIKNASSSLIHCWHGDHESRPYHTWGLVFNELMFDKAHIKIDNQGLLAWTSTDILEKYAKFFANKHKITSVTEHQRLYK